MANTTDTATEITLKGSVDIVSEFFFTAINSILYQRGIYQPESFKREAKYGLTVLTTTDKGLLQYLSQVMAQVDSWLLNGDVQRFVVVVSGVESGATLERWQFNVALDDEAGTTTTGGNGGLENITNTNNSSNNNSDDDGGGGKRNTTTAAKKKKNTTTKKKTIKEINGEIQAIVRQITASVTFLPLLNEPCSFDLLVYTKKDAQVPTKWEDSDPCYIMNSQEVKLRSFTTSVHKVDSMVAYREAEDWEL